MPVVSSILYLLEQPSLYTQLGMVSSLPPYHCREFKKEA